MPHSESGLRPPKICLRRAEKTRALVGGHGCGRFCAVESKPGARRLEAIVDVLNVLDALAGEPIFECVDALLRVDGNAFLPRRPPAENAGKIHSGFGGEFEGLGEDVIVDTCL